MSWTALDGTVFEHYGQYQAYMDNLLNFDYIEVGDKTYDAIYIDSVEKFIYVIEWCKYHYNSKFENYLRITDKFVGKYIYILYESAEWYDDAVCSIMTPDELLNELQELRYEVDYAIDFVKEQNHA